MPHSPDKKRKNRRDYLDNFRKDAAGNYIYEGAHLRLLPGRFSPKGTLALGLGLTALMAGAILLAGCLPAPGALNSFYVLVPYAASFVAAGMVGWAWLRMAAGGPRLREYVWQETAQKLPGRCKAAALAAALTGAGQLLYLALHRGQGWLVTLGYLACMALAGALALALDRLAQKMDWARE